MSWTLKQQVMKVTVIMTVSQVVPRIYTVRLKKFQDEQFFCCIGNFVTYTTKRSAGCARCAEECCFSSRTSARKAEQVPQGLREMGFRGGLVRFVLCESRLLHSPFLNTFQQRTEQKEEGKCQTYIAAKQ